MTNHHSCWLETWSKGAPAQWTPLPPVRHPEVNQGSRDIPSDHNLAFGPILTAKKMAPIQALESTTLRLGFDSRVKSADRLQIISALTLMNLYGTLGGRSRNGWGSFDLAPLDGTPALDPLPVTAVFRDWKEALGCDWPHAMGSGDAPLVWRTQTMTDWRLVMQTLARIKIALRTQFSFAGHATPHRSPLGRHWLAYPVTKHDVQGWKGLRMPNTLRFKVRLDGNDATRPYAVIFHVPCKPTRDFAPDLNAITKVWTSVHAFLDSRDDLSRIPA